MQPKIKIDFDNDRFSIVETILTHFIKSEYKKFAWNDKKYVLFNDWRRRSYHLLLKKSIQHLV